MVDKIIDKLPHPLQVVVLILKETIEQFLDDNATLLGAGIAYFMLFSIAPLVLIAITTAGLVFGETFVESRVMLMIEELVGRPGAEAVNTLLVSVQQSTSSGLATAISAVMVLVGAHMVFNQLQHALNLVWDVPLESRTGILHAIRKRAITFLMTLSVGFLLILSFLSSLILGVFHDALVDLIPGWSGMITLADMALSVAMITLLIALIYKVLPDTVIHWRDVMVGSFATAVMLQLGALAVTTYLRHTAITSAYGAASSLVFILVWMYYNAQIFLLGAEFTQVWSRRHGKEIRARERRGTNEEEPSDQEPTD